jgi:hypothetical protein
MLYCIHVHLCSFIYTAFYNRNVFSEGFSNEINIFYIYALVLMAEYTLILKHKTA